MLNKSCREFFSPFTLHETEESRKCCQKILTWTSVLLSPSVGPSAAILTNVR